MAVKDLKCLQYVNQGSLPTCGIQHGIGSTPAVIEVGQFMGAVVFEEAEDV